MALKDLADHSPRRRRVLKTLLAGTAAAALSPLGARSASFGQSEKPARLAKDGMLYRRLGRTGLMISEIVLGGSPFPDYTLLRELFDRGINYFDTSESYENGNSDRLIGRLCRDVGRDKVFIHSRFHLNRRSTEASLIASVDASLRRLGTDFVDIQGIHGVEKPEELVDGRVLAAFERLKAQGKFRFRGLTCHVNQHNVVPRAVECGIYDMIQMGYNIFDIQETEKDVRSYGDYLGESGGRQLIALAHGRDVGVIAMKVLKVGGRRQDLAKYRTAGGSIQQAMLKWALDNDQLSAVVTEILNRREMAEDLGAVGQPLAPPERKALFVMASDAGPGVCHMCGICRSACPAGIDTAGVMRSLAYLDVYGKQERARSEYREIRAAKRAPDTGAVTFQNKSEARLGVAADEPGKSGPEACGSCDACNRACPYGNPVREHILRAASLLG